MDDGRNWPSVGRLAEPLVRDLVDRAQELRIGVSRAPEGHTLIDAGIDHPGGVAAGLRIAEICMGGLGRVSLGSSEALERWPWTLTVSANHLVLACLGSQYAGWSLSDGDGKQAYKALGSGPGRARVVKESLFEELGYRDHAETAVFVLEVEAPPPQSLIEKIVRDSGLPASALTLILTPTQSLAGTVQVVARVLEVALHKLHELDFPLECVIDGVGSVPLPPPARDFVQAMGRTNDAIIYGGSVQLFVTGPDDEAKELAERLPSGASRDYGKPFAETFRAVKGDFYTIDPMLFSPARVTVTALDSGRSFHAGALDPTLIDRSFG